MYLALHWKSDDSPSCVTSITQVSEPQDEKTTTVLDPEHGREVVQFMSCGSDEKGGKKILLVPEKSTEIHFILIEEAQSPQTYSKDMCTLHAFLSTDVRDGYLSDLFLHYHTLGADDICSEAESDKNVNCPKDCKEKLFKELKESGNAEFESPDCEGYYIHYWTVGSFAPPKPPVLVESHTFK
jgi:hypothetical protein